MKLLAVCFAANQADKEHIVKVVGVANSLGWPLEIIDVRNSPVDIKDIAFIFSFGPKASLMVDEEIKKHSSGTPTLSLPSVKQLYPVEQGGEEAARSKALSELVLIAAAFKEDEGKFFQDKKLSEGLKVDQLPDFSIAKIQALEKAVRESGKSTWLCITKQKKTLALTLDGKIESTEDIDIVMSFSELIAIRAAIDILGVQEIKFVQKQIKGNVNV